MAASVAALACASLALGGVGACAAAAENNRIADRIIGVNKEIQQNTYRRNEAGRDIIIKEAADAVQAAQAQIVTEVWGWFKKLLYGLGILAVVTIRGRNVVAPFKAVKAVARFVLPSRQVRKPTPRSGKSAPVAAGLERSNR